MLPLMDVVSTTLSTMLAPVGTRILLLLVLVLAEQAVVVVEDLIAVILDL
eukprot:CAMPEP_0174991072 /NCGR_PEP_ID=MMETSP0004_2-20121128/21676_1 /TAXON_ID=420556 /ORGANISM="Ochromonas sp., Strain CCMP1393" /LENGTH=49 /DNA_ID=CAMNT_0016244755 /DNA_START=313 /DNA_END=462 /DNA_ORIENTATION=+